jgi:Asp-tRNA(Asn)/Glu-tRNA(Gln) amidotransferase C subunit
MRFLIIVVVLVLVGIAGLGYYRGWFVVSTESAGPTPSATVTVDKAKFREDEQKARDDVQAFGQDAKKKIGDRDGNAKAPQRQP